MDVPYTAWQDMSIHFIESSEFPLKENLPPVTGPYMSYKKCKSRTRSQIKETRKRFCR